MLKVCISGGPGSGKSSAQSVLMQQLAERGYKTLFCPETATELILNGIVPGDTISLEEFQKFVLDKQLAKEKLYEEIAEYYNKDKLVILYDRGLCDQMAYISKDKFEKMLKERNMTLSDAYNHYDCVFHLVTAAKGALEFYVWNDPSKEDCGNNAARSESPEEAIIKDEKTLEAWIGHPHLRVFDNTTNFEGKLKRITDELFTVLGEPIPKEIERKFLIKKPTIEEINALGYISKSNIIQTYLYSKDKNIERRIRQRGSKKEGFTFYYTEKTNIKNGERHEVEDRISPSEYISYLTEVDTSLHQISKERYCFIYDNKYYELDLYPFSDDYAILEIELNDINEKLNLPPWTIIKEVTDDINYKNYSLAKTLKLKEPEGAILIESKPVDATPWRYEVGREEPEILGSGSSYYSQKICHSDTEAFELVKQAGRNYIHRQRKENGKIVKQYYDFYDKEWITY